MCPQHGLFTLHNKFCKSALIGFQDFFVFHNAARIWLQEMSMHSFVMELSTKQVL
jgi:hypothetical protein